MSREDVERYIELEAPGVGVVSNDPTSVACLGCGDDVRVDPATLVLEDDSAVEVMARGSVGGDVYAVELFCSPGCRNSFYGVDGR